MIISLDRNALKALIDSDLEFELSLKAAVISEVGRRFFEKDAARVIAAASPELFTKALQGLTEDEDLLGKVNQALSTKLTKRDGDYYARMKLTDEAKRLIETYADTIRRDALLKVSSDLEAAYSALIKKTVEEKFDAPNIEEKIERRVNYLVNAEINRQVDEKFKARIADLKSMIGG